MTLFNYPGWMENTPTKTRPYHHGDLRRALVDAALQLVAEQQDWSFSLREVARRAGVSHSAPHKHFATKRDLLSAVAAVGFDMMRECMVAAGSEVAKPESALAATGLAYVTFAAENPALYRLMFGGELAGTSPHPDPAQEAGARAKAVLDAVIRRGAEARRFDVSPNDEQALGMAALTCWASVHGLAMLLVDGRAEPVRPTAELVQALVGHLLSGLQKRGEMAEAS